MVLSFDSQEPFHGASILQKELSDLKTWTYRNKEKPNSRDKFEFVNKWINKYIIELIISTELKVVEKTYKNKEKDCMKRNQERHTLKENTASLCPVCLLTVSNALEFGRLVIALEDLDKSLGKIGVRNSKQHNLLRSTRQK